MKFCDKLTKLRKNNNMSQEQLADKLGVSRQAVSKWESGSSYPDMAKILELCKILNCSLEDLVDDGIPGNNKLSESKITINTYLNEVLDFITKTLNMFWSMTIIEKIKCILEMSFLLFIIFIIWALAGSIVSSIFRSILFMLPQGLSNIIYNLSSIIYQIFGLIVGAIIFIHIFKIRYLDYFITIEDNNIEKKTKEIPIEEMEDKEEKKERKFIEHKKNKIIIRDPKHSTYNFFTVLAHIVLWTTKFILLFVAIPCIISFIFFAFALTTSIYLTKSGIFFLGTTIILIGCLLVNYIILKIIYDFILDQKQNFKKIFSIFILGLIFTGIGSGISFTTYLTFKSTNTSLEELEYITKEETIQYKEDIILSFLDWDITEIIEDNNQKDIKLEISYNKEGKIALGNNQNTYYEHYSTDGYIYKNCTEYYIHYTEDNNMIDELNYLIDKLENKERIDNDISRTYGDISKIKVYISKENLEKIKNNQEYNYE